MPDQNVGWGVINPVSALTAPVGGASPTPAPPSAAVSAVVVDLPPEAPDNSWSIVIAGLLLALAGGIAAVVAGVRRAGRRKWRPATEQAPTPRATTTPLS